MRLGLAPVLLLGLALHGAGVLGRKYKLGLLTPWAEDLEFSGRFSAAAVDVAIERIRGDRDYNRNGEIELE